MKVYLLVRCEINGSVIDDRAVEAIYATREAAEAEMAMLISERGSRLVDYEVEEWTVLT